jgi:uncharacterized protein
MDAPQFTAFTGHRRLARGTAADVALALKVAYDRGEAGLLAFEDATGRQVDFDLRGGPGEIAARYEAPAPARRGRPRLGVTPREVTLLPRHWEWLAAQPGGASAALRRLVQAAMTSDASALRRRRDAAYNAMAALAGDLPGFEEASRALFAGEAARFGALIAGWPKDVRDYLCEIASSPA